MEGSPSWGGKQNWLDFTIITGVCLLLLCCWLLLWLLVDEDEEEDDDDDVGAGGGDDGGGGGDDDDGGGANLLMMRCLKPNVQSEEDPNLSLLSFSFQGVDVVLVRNVFMERWEWANDGMDMMMFSMLRGEASLKIWTMLRLVFLNGVKYELYPMHIFIYIYIIYIYIYSCTNWSMYFHPKTDNHAGLRSSIKTWLHLGELGRSDQLWALISF